MISRACRSAPSRTGFKYAQKPTRRLNNVQRKADYNMRGRDVHVVLFALVLESVD